MNYVSRILANARVKCTGVPDSATKLELFNAVSEFCKETDIWKEAIDVTIIAGDDVVYDLVPALGNPLRLVSLVNENGTPWAAKMDTPGELVIRPGLEAGVVVTATVSLYPVDPVDSDGFPEIPEWIWQRYYGLFIDGVQHKLMAQPDKPYTNLATSAFHGRRWRNGISITRSDVTKSNVRNAQKWRFPFFA